MGSFQIKREVEIQAQYTDKAINDEMKKHRISVTLK